MTRVTETHTSIRIGPVELVVIDEAAMTAASLGESVVGHGRRAPIAIEIRTLAGSMLVDLRWLTTAVHAPAAGDASR